MGVSDDVLREWLAAQPDVTDSSVSRDGQTVAVEYVGPLRGSQPLLDPVGQAERLGYRGLRGFAGTMKSRW